MPLSRNTGASATRTISATVLTERSGELSNMAQRYATARRARLVRGSSQLATSSSIRPLTTKLAARIQAKLAISSRVGPKRLIDEGRDRQAGDQQHGEQEIHAGREGRPQAHRAVESRSSRRQGSRLRISSQPMIGQTRREEMGFRVEDEQQAGKRGHDACGHGERPCFAPKRAGDRLDQASGDQQAADHVGGDRLAGREQSRAGARAG